MSGIQLNEFLDLSLNNNPLYDLYDANELTILEAEKIIQELNQGKELSVILPAYLSDEVDVQQVYDFFLQTASLTQGLRRYNFTEGEVKKKIAHYPIIKSKHRNDLKESILTRSSWGRIEYKRCVRYAEDDYDGCYDRAVRYGVRTWTGYTVAGMAATWYTGGIGGLLVGGGFVGPLIGYINYADASRFCTEDLEKEIIRCEEKYL